MLTGRTPARATASGSKGRAAWSLALAAQAALSACTGLGDDLPRQCQAGMKLPGSYVYPAGVAAPEVRPGRGGTERGAALINACIDREAELAGLSQTPGAGTSIPAGATGSGRVTLGRTDRKPPIYPAAPEHPDVVYAPVPEGETAATRKPDYTRRPACRPRQRGVTQEPLFC